MKIIADIERAARVATQRAIFMRRDDPEGAEALMTLVHGAVVLSGAVEAVCRLDTSLRDILARTIHLANQQMADGITELMVDRGASSSVADDIVAKATGKAASR